MQPWLQINQRMVRKYSNYQTVQTCLRELAAGHVTLLGMRSRVSAPSRARARELDRRLGRAPREIILALGCPSQFERPMNIAAAGGVSFLPGLHGAVVLFCGLLFAEDAGVPLPFAPGELVLLA